MGAHLNFDDARFGRFSAVEQHCRGDIFGIEHVGLCEALLGPFFSQANSVLTPSGQIAPTLFHFGAVPYATPEQTRPGTAWTYCISLDATLSPAALYANAAK
jgi:hypothetical protein